MDGERTVNAEAEVRAAVDGGGEDDGGCGSVWVVRESRGQSEWVRERERTNGS